MSVSDADIAFALELFEGIGPLTTRKMMGGLCLYSEGTIFAMLHSDGAILLKGQGDFKTVLGDAGWQPWTYTRKDGAASSMPYWFVPDDVLDDADLACDWARRALAVLR
ncbi:TfoX/Sxy family protein [Aliiroseovarius subalbicans]|uniref:TfoX/Sxy family protein n=1 Tax=Aliiroseovarius subalbicans TaxID=2925840 RepID=UPI001F5ABA24|nr:TfoX/Sxy family protein [Aliiroseovarius subalbicans]MCI2398724.1 TfoX/Sxy family protein [Aliiroseovarius subalbicans]